MKTFQHETVVNKCTKLFITLINKDFAPSKKKKK